MPNRNGKGILLFGGSSGDVFNEQITLLGWKDVAHI